MYLYIMKRDKRGMKLIMKRAFLFPGQGAQVVGMGKDFYEQFEEARKIYDTASKISGIDIKRLCFEGQEEELNKTENTQIAILTTSLAILEILKSKNIQAQITTGLSLGEYASLIYSGYISFEDGIKLIQKRGYYMGNIIPDEEFSMAAVIGFETKKIEEVCKHLKNHGNFVVPANYNYSGQTVISGNVNAVNLAIEKLKELGARKIIKLKTSGPFHTEKLNEAKKEYEKELDKIEFKKGNIKVIKNIDGTFYNENDNIKEILAKHIISSVRFDKAIKLMETEGIEEYVEIGPGKALTGFIKKENRDANIVNINNVEALNNYLFNN